MYNFSSEIFEVIVVVLREGDIDFIPLFTDVAVGAVSPLSFISAIWLFLQNSTEDDF